MLKSRRNGWLEVVSLDLADCSWVTYTVLYVSRMVAHLASIFVVASVAENFRWSSKAWYVSWKIEITVLSVFTKVAHLRGVLSVEFVFFAFLPCATLFLAKALTIFLFRSRFMLISGSDKFSLFVKHVESLRAAHSEFLVLVVFPSQQLLKSQNWVNLENQPHWWTCNIRWYVSPRFRVSEATAGRCFGTCSQGRWSEDRGQDQSWECHPNRSRVLPCYAVAVMDRIGGLEEGRKTRKMGWVKIRSEHVDLHESCCVKIFKSRSIMEAVSWVCDDALYEHVWVSEHTISLQEAKVVEALQYDFEIPCTAQWGVLGFFARTSLHIELLNDGEILGKHFEAVNLAFQSVLGAPYLEWTHPGSFSWKQWGKFWKMWLEELSYSGLGTRWTAWFVVWQWRQWQRPGTLGPVRHWRAWVLPFVASQSIWACLSSSPSPSPQRSRLRVKKKLAILKRATTKKNSGWSSKGWRTKSGWHQSLVSDGSQCSKDQPNPRGKWKGVSNVVGDWVAAWGEENLLAKKSCKISWIENKKLLFLLATSEDQRRRRGERTVGRCTGQEEATRRRHVERIWRIHCFVGHREETDVFLKHENLATDTAVRQKRRTRRMTSRKRQQRQDFGWSEGKSPPEHLL